MDPTPRTGRPWLRLTNAGLELAAAVGGFVLLGYWVDRHFSTRPWGVLAGMALGLVGGMYNLVKGARAAAAEAGEDDRRRKRER